MKQLIHLMTKINNKQTAVSVDPKDLNDLSKWEQFEYNVSSLAAAAKSLAEEAEEIYKDMMNGKMFMPRRFHDHQ